MRNITLATTAVLTIGFASAMLAAGFVTPVNAQPQMTVQQKMAAMKAKDAKSYAACLAIAQQRGFSNDPENSDGVMMFVDGCMAGRLR
jgi:hypothetical protein